MLAPIKIRNRTYHHYTTMVPGAGGPAFPGKVEDRSFMSPKKRIRLKKTCGTFLDVGGRNILFVIDHEAAPPGSGEWVFIRDVAQTLADAFPKLDARGQGRAGGAARGGLRRIAETVLRQRLERELLLRYRRVQDRRDQPDQHGLCGLQHRPRRQPCPARPRRQEVHRRQGRGRLLEAPGRQPGGIGARAARGGAHPGLHRRSRLGPATDGFRTPDRAPQAIFRPTSIAPTRSEPPS